MSYRATTFSLQTHSGCDISNRVSLCVRQCYPLSISVLSQKACTSAWVLFLTVTHLRLVPHPPSKLLASSAPLSCLPVCSPNTGRKVIYYLYFEMCLPGFLCCVAHSFVGLVALCKPLLPIFHQTMIFPLYADVRLFFTFPLSSKGGMPSYIGAILLYHQPLHFLAQVLGNS